MFTFDSIRNFRSIWLFMCTVLGRNIHRKREGRTSSSTMEEGKSEGNGATGERNDEASLLDRTYPGIDS